MMKAVSGMQIPEWTDAGMEYGGLLLQTRHPVLKQYLEKELRIRGQILSRLEDASGEAAVQRKEEVMEERRLILAALERYEG